MGGDGRGLGGARVSKAASNHLRGGVTCRAYRREVSRAALCPILGWAIVCKKGVQKGDQKVRV
jgi:hypothetical protein